MKYTNEGHKSKRRSLVLKACILLFGIFFFFLAYIGLGVFLIYPSIKKVQADLTGLKISQSQRDFHGVSNSLNNLSIPLQDINSKLGYFALLNVIPVVNRYYENATYIVSSLVYIDKGAIKVADSAEPVASSLGYTKNSVAGSQKIAMFVQSLPVLSIGLNNSQSDFDSASMYVNEIDPNYLPDITIKGINLKSAFVQYKVDFLNLVKLIPQIKTLSPIIQSALGYPVEQNYLMLFQNDKELRPDGGFISVYGYLNFKNGVLGNLSTSDIYNIDQYIQYKPIAPAQLREYNFASTWYLRDANLSPDIPTSSLEIEKFYNSSFTLPKIDGIVFVDTQFVGSLINAVGPSIYLPTYNKYITASNFAYYLEYYAEKADVNLANRKEFVNVLMTALKKKIFEAQKGDLLNLINVGITDFSQKHIAIYANDPTLEGTLLKFNWGGAFPVVHNKDFFAMLEANLGGAKADFYIKRYYTQSITKTADGYLKTVEVKFTNNQVYDDWLNGPYKAWVRFYLPFGSRFVSILGTDGTNRVYNELGYLVVDNHIRVPVKYRISDPASYLNVILKYYIPSNLVENGYSLYFVKQSGVTSEDVNITYNGKNISESLFTDEQLNF